MTDLLPCPFCGGEAKFTYHNGSWPDHCYNVECADWKCPSRSGGRSSEAYAAELWNTRSDAAVKAARREALEEAAKVADHIMRDYAELTYSPHHDKMQNAAKTYCAGEIATAIRALAEKET